MFPKQMQNTRPYNREFDALHGTLCAQHESFYRRVVKLLATLTSMLLINLQTDVLLIMQMLWFYY